MEVDERAQNGKEVMIHERLILHGLVRLNYTEIPTEVI